MVELGRLEPELEHVDEELPEVGGGGGVICHEGVNEILDPVAGGEAEDLGDDRRGGACRQAVAGHSTRLPEQQPPRLEVDHVACRDVVLLTVHDDRGTGGDDGDEAAETTRPFHPAIGLVVVKHDTGEAAGVTPGPSPLHEAGGGLGEPVQGVTIHMA